jgi:hypothetical protein
MAKQYDLETQTWADVIDIHEPDEVLPDIDGHGYLQGVYRGQIQPSNSRLRAAIASLPFEKPKLAVVANVRENDLAERLMRALQASGRVINARPMNVIEPPKVEAAPPDEIPDYSGPFAQNSKHRFRRF